MNSHLADILIVDQAGIYTHFGADGRCDGIEIPNSHFQLQRTGTEWGITVTVGPPGEPTGILTLNCTITQE